MFAESPERSRLGSVGVPLSRSPSIISRILTVRRDGPVTGVRADEPAERDTWLKEIVAERELDKLIL